MIWSHDHTKTRGILYKLKLKRRKTIFYSFGVPTKSNIQLLLTNNLNTVAKGMMLLTIVGSFIFYSHLPAR
ncbi:MAG TPA: hypothetical protein VII94_02920, partial [Candidatus Saccharimonadales bacterium]